MSQLVRAERSDEVNCEVKNGERLSGVGEQVFIRCMIRPSQKV